ncbi:protein kinase [Lachnospiraceae bacterium Oil+RF-744-WCA-WT-13]|uniref:non-specific serine/threonine protein kinase n=2 Tax=Bilifractor porci TaxID=2606636 RepID=A0A7X2TPK3_9FIRM|nr:protein kinase [Bilifractor porci]
MWQTAGRMRMTAIREGAVIHNTYEIKRPIGEGAGGSVYLAWHLNLQKYVVIKRIKDKYVGNINERREVDILKKLHHRYIPQVYDFIQEGGDVYTVIDYIDGNTMQDYIDRQVKFEEPQVIKWMHQILEALDYIHTQAPPVIHNDIKPNNIMISADGDACLIDFNISSNDYGERDIEGYSKGYASPELMHRIRLYSTGGRYFDVHLDARSDLFSLAASFYSLMTGERPTVREKDTMRLRKPLWHTDCIYSNQLCGVLTRALSENPDQRPQSAAEMLNDLDSMKLRDEEYLRLTRSRKRFNFLAAVLMTLGIMSAGFGYYFLTQEQFHDKYAEISSLAEQGAYNEVETKAENLLNDGRYRLVLNRDPDGAANLCYLAAEAYFEQEDYDNAITYFTCAADAGIKNADCYRDYAIALARSGRADEAQKIAGQADTYDLNSANLDLVLAEIGMSDGKEDLSAVVGKLQQVVAEADEDEEEIKLRAIIDLADVYERRGSYGDAIQTLREAEKEFTEPSWQRRVQRALGNAYVLEMNTEGSGSESPYAEDAERIFRSLTEDTAAADYNDYMNLSQICQMRGEYDEAEEVLQKLFGTDEGKNRYEVPMRLALIEIERQGKIEDEGSRDYSKAEQYDEQAEKLYEKTEDNGGDAGSDLMQQLRNQMDALRSGGWLDKED